MLPVIWGKKKDSNFLGLDDENEGLRILTKIANRNPKILVKPIFRLNQITQEKHTYSLLKSCHLCHKTLSLDKEVYMYRGDLGFCSVTCRERQMYLDEMKDIEISTKKILASFKHRSYLHPADGGGRCETGRLLEEFRQRRHPFASQNNQVIFS